MSTNDDYPAFDKVVGTMVIQAFAVIAMVQILQILIRLANDE